MNVKLFQKIADVLLQTHFGIAVDDTHLSSEPVVRHLVEERIRPFDAVNGHAAECDLVRTDIRGTWGIPTFILLKAEDELKVLRTIQPTQLVGEEMVECGLCGTRTEFDEVSKLGSGLQHHRCLNSVCGNEFLSEPDTDDDDCNADLSATVGG